LELVKLLTLDLEKGEIDISLSRILRLSDVYRTIVSELLKDI